jgi:hypothetical protein
LSAGYRDAGSVIEENTATAASATKRCCAWYAMLEAGQHLVECRGEAPPFIVRNADIDVADMKGFWQT